MGSTLLSTPIIAPTKLDRHEILRNFCHESVRKGLNLSKFGVPERRGPVVLVRDRGFGSRSLQQGGVRNRAWHFIPVYTRAYRRDGKPAAAGRAANSSRKQKTIPPARIAGLW